MTAAKRVWTIISPDGSVFIAEHSDVILHQPVVEIADCDNPEAPMERVSDGPLQFSASIRRP